jgi:hypothetical protein
VRKKKGQPQKREDSFPVTRFLRPRPEDGPSATRGHQQDTVNTCPVVEFVVPHDSNPG